MLRLLPLKKLSVDENAMAVEALVVAMRHEMRDENWWGGSGLRKIAQARPDLYDPIVSRQGRERGLVALALLRKAKTLTREGYGHREDCIREDLVALADQLVSAKGALEPSLFPSFVLAWIEAPLYGTHHARPVAVAESLVIEHGLTPEIEQGTHALLTNLESRHIWGDPPADQRRLALRIRQLLDPENAERLRLTEPWQASFADAKWTRMLDHAASTKGTAPSDRWTKAARPLLETVGADAFLDAFAEAVEAIARMAVLVDSIHSDMLRGLAWMAGLVGTPRAAALLGRLVVASAHKLPNFGARSTKGFSGALGALERMGMFASIAELSNARNRVKAASLSAALAAALDRAARRQELSVEELEELVVPTYGLELPGVRTETTGEVEAALEIVGSTDVEIRWSRGGKALKSAPAEAKTLDKELKLAKKEIESALAAQRSRLEGLMLSGRTLPYPVWRERYLDHPLLASMARRLVWRFDSPLASGDGSPWKEERREGGTVGEGVEHLGIAPNGTPLDVEGRPLDSLGEGTTVRLWHPIDAGAAAIEAWRDELVTREIRQPFKQAYREIYLLTAAEERTGTYSNRFAAHILKQHQMAALARSRGWRYALQGYFDNPECHPTFDLPPWGLRVEYFVEVPHNIGVADVHMTETGIALYVVTDQVRFVDRTTDAPIPLTEVPPTVFSEAMRDVDLLVGVASVGNDANWADQGERTGYGAYWREVSFGDLSASAQTRKAALERLLPRLALGKVARLDGRFLVVTGKRRTYKIHLGSGNILMEPNDQYLCIVPGSAKGAADRVFLPFEGDGVLAIVLSKATMLADDDRITDPTILRQLGLAPSS